MKSIEFFKKIFEEKGVICVELIRAPTAASIMHCDASLQLVAKLELLSRKLSSETYLLINIAARASE